MPILLGLRTYHEEQDTNCKLSIESYASYSLGFRQLDHAGYARSFHSLPRSSLCGLNHSLNHIPVCNTRTLRTRRSREATVAVSEPK